MSKSVYGKIVLVVLLAFTVACREEENVPEPAPSPTPEVRTLHYKATVQTGAATRATIAENLAYVFEKGDRVYVESVDGEGEPDGNLYGFLSLAVNGDEGKKVALFEGDLTCAESFTPSSDTPVKLVLMSDLLSITDDGKASGVNYLTTQWAATLKEAVSHLGYFTGSGQFGDTSFTLNQQSSFLNCSVKMDSEEAYVGRTISVELYNNTASEPIRTADIEVREAGSLPFVFAFPGNEVQLVDAKITLKLGTDSEKDFSINNSSQALAANYYYTVSRSTIPFDGFRIIATKDDTRLTFKYSDGSVQYSEDGGESWYTYDGKQFTLDKDDSVCFQGNRADCDCNGTTQLFTADKVCYIAGKITSLLNDPNSLAPNAFRSAFSNGNSNNTGPAAVTFVDINPDDPLILPPFTANNCYREMFRNCTSLKSVPALPATEVAPNCYFNMFRSCIELTRADIELPAETMTENCYREIFRQCTKLTSVPVFKAKTLATSCYQQMLSGCTSLGSVVCLATDVSANLCLDQWMSGIKSTGTLYQAEGGPFSPGENGVPSGWTVETYTE